MPAEGIDLTPSDKLLSFNEIIRIARLFVSQAVTKIRLTGGEPTIRKDIVDLVREWIFDALLWTIFLSLRILTNNLACHIT